MIESGRPWYQTTILIIAFAKFGKLIIIFIGL